MSVAELVRSLQGLREEVTNTIASGSPKQHGEAALNYIERLLTTLIVAGEEEKS